MVAKSRKRISLGTFFAALSILPIRADISKMTAGQKSPGWVKATPRRIAGKKTVSPALSNFLPRLDSQPYLLASHPSSQSLDRATAKRINAKSH